MNFPVSSPNAAVEDSTSDATNPAARPSSLDADNSGPRIAIIGTGFGGLGAAIELRKAGYGRIALFEREGEVGGVWRDNTYPGAACDVQSYLYSFSFARSPEWDNMFAKQPEIYAYLKEVAKDHDLYRDIRFNEPVEAAHWDAARCVWTLTTAQGVQDFEHVVVATGALADPIIPNIPGVEDFQGASFHSSRWDHSVDHKGKKVAVVGTGASAIQIVPAIQPDVEKLTLFQRTPAWVLPRHDADIDEKSKARQRKLPVLNWLKRYAIFTEREFMVLGFQNPLIMKIVQGNALKHMKKAIKDPALVKALTPNYRIGCKRILLSNTYYPALASDNVEVVTNGVASVDATGIVDSAGQHHEVDIIVYGTGFHTLGLPLTDKIFDENGRSMAEVQGPSPTSYMSTTVHGFPNMYLIHGPNLALGHTSMITMFEAQFRYIVNCVKAVDQGGFGSLEPTESAQREYTSMVDKKTGGTVWISGGCDSWYLDSTGRNSVIWPGSTLDYHRRARSFKADDHQFSVATADAESAVAEGRDLGPTLLLHGLGSSGDCFNKLRAVFPSSSVAAPTMTSPDSIETDATSVLGELRALSEANGGQKVTIIGHSRGGLVATELARMAPELVRKVVLINSPASLESRNTSGRSAEKLLHKPVIGPIAWNLMSPGAAKKGLASAFAPGYTVPDLFARDLKATGLKKFMQATQSLLDYLEAEPLVERLKKLDVPVQIIFGEQDLRVQSYPYEELNAEEADVRTIPEAGHTPIWETPEIVVDYLLSSEN